MISRRRLFGLSAAAGAAIIAKDVTSYPAEDTVARDIWAALDAYPPGYERKLRKLFLFSEQEVYYIPSSNFRNIERVNLREIETDI